MWRYPQYAAHARWELLRAAGVAQDKLIASGVGPVTPENTIRSVRELRGGDELRVTCASEWSDGKTIRLRQESRRMDGTAAAPDRLLRGRCDPVRGIPKIFRYKRVRTP